MSDEIQECNGVAPLPQAESKAVYEVVPSWSGDGYDVKRNGELVRRGFDSDAQAQAWVDSQED
jgi:hypothetical protein